MYSHTVELLGRVDNWKLWLGIFLDSTICIAFIANFILFHFVVICCRCDSFR